MITMSYTPQRRKALEAAISRVLTPAQQTMVRELLCAEDPTVRAPKAEEMLYWIRFNMPRAAARIEFVLHPAE